MEISMNQTQHWDTWNSKYRDLDATQSLDEACKRRMQEVLRAIAQLDLRGSRLLEVGCGTGWLSSKLTAFGQVAAVDLGKEIIDAAKERHPEIDFRSGDIHSVDFEPGSFDAIVTLETFSHVPDQAAFVRRLSQLLKPNGSLLLTTQNKWVFERKAGIGPAVGYTRQWVDVKTLKRLLQPQFSICSLTTLEPDGHLGVLKVVNSRKVNRVVSSMLGKARIKRLKEQAGFGQTIFVTCKKK